MVIWLLVPNLQHHLVCENALKNYHPCLISQGFNKELEEIYRVQKAFAIPDQELRSTLKEDNRNYIMPFYSGFLKRYRATNFTKNPDKYIKYSEADLVKYIDGFFDAAA